MDECVRARHMAHACVAGGAGEGVLARDTYMSTVDAQAGQDD